MLMMNLLNSNSCFKLLVRMIRHRIFFWIVIWNVIILLFLVSCSSSKKMSNTNLSSMLQPDQGVIAATAIIYNNSIDSSTIYFSIPKSKLLFRNEDGDFVARYSVSYTLFPFRTSTTIIDSSTYFFLVSDSLQISNFQDSIKFRCPNETYGTLRVNFTDLNRKSEFTQIINVNKADSKSRQTYLLKDQQGVPLFRNYISSRESFQIESINPPTQKFWVRCYFRNYPIAVMPFKIIDSAPFSYACDSLFQVQMDSIPYLILERKGIYHFVQDTNFKSGVTMFIFDEDFPLITQSSQLIAPTRYLTSSKEFKEMNAAKDKKLAIEKFWLNLGVNESTTRSLIRTYFNRVQLANKYFTSYTEGWKTDRGMILIVHGTPLSIFNDGESEIWNYAANTSLPELTFYFKKVNNPFTDNDFSLVRQPYYDNSWYTAVDLWRQGRILNE